MIRPGIDSSWIRTIDGKFTFCGALEECYNSCAKNWKQESTRSQYDRDYNDKILPALKEHDCKSIDEYTIEDFEDAIETITKRGQGKAGDLFVPYAPATLQHFRHLIEVVVTAAADRQFCNHVLWGSCFSLESDFTEQDALRERVLLKKSLTPSQEFQIAEELLTDEAQFGQNMGLLLMFALGLRNGEACGANYGDLKPMGLAPESTVLWVYKSTKAGKRELQSSGKTRNSDRIIPVPEEVERFLLRRRSYLKESLKRDGIPADDEIIDQLPIACVQNNFTVRCSAAQLTAAGRELFRKIGMREYQLAYTEGELNHASDENPLEKDPTAYLFRRNFGTHLHILGLTESEIEYVVGHDIEDLYETRNEFVNEEKLLEIKKKMDQRPILNTSFSKIDIIDTQNQAGAISLSSPQRFYLSSDTLILHFEAEEPSDSLKVVISPLSQSAPIVQQTFVSSKSPQNRRIVNIVNRYHELYQGQKSKGK